MRSASTRSKRDPGADGDVTLRLGIPEPLQRYCSGESEVEVEGATLGALLRDLGTRFPCLADRALDSKGGLQPHLVVIRNDRVVAREGLLETVVDDSDDLRLFAAASGG